MKNQSAENHTYVGWYIAEWLRNVEPDPWRWSQRTVAPPKGSSQLIWDVWEWHFTNNSDWHWEGPDPYLEEGVEVGTAAQIKAMLAAERVMASERGLVAFAGVEFNPWDYFFQTQNSADKIFDATETETPVTEKATQVVQKLMNDVTSTT